MQIFETFKSSNKMNNHVCIFQSIFHNTPFIYLIKISLFPFTLLFSPDRRLS